MVRVLCEIVYMFYFPSPTGAVRWQAEKTTASKDDGDSQRQRLGESRRRGNINVAGISTSRESRRRGNLDGAGFTTTRESRRRGNLDDAGFFTTRKSSTKTALFRYIDEGPFVLLSVHRSVHPLRRLIFVHLSVLSLLSGQRQRQPHATKPRMAT